MLSVGAGFEVGNVTVTAEDNRGHSLEFWADGATKRICGISKNADPHVRQQAEAFKHRIRDEILHAIRCALRSDRQTIAGALRRDGFEIVAAQLLAYKIDG